MRIVIVGAGGHGFVIKEMLEDTLKYECIDFVDDKSISAIGRVAELESLRNKYDAAFVSIGNNDIRKKIMERLVYYKYQIPTLIHSTAFVSKSAQIDIGTVVEANVVISANAKIGKGCIISVGAIIDHNAVIEDFSHVNAGAIVKAGSRVLSGMKVDAGKVIDQLF